MLTRGPFRTREHPLEAGRNCSSSHVPQSSQASPPPKKSAFHEPLFLAKKKECPLFSGEQWGSPCQQSRVSARAAPSLPTSWVEEKSTLSARRLKKSGNEKPPSPTVPKRDIWRALQEQPHRSSDTKVFLTYYPFQTGPHSAAEADLKLKLFLPTIGIIGMLLPPDTDSFSINLKRRY